MSTQPIRAVDVLHAIGAPRPAPHAEPWEPIIPLSPPRILPSFPLDVLPDWLYAMTYEVTIALQVPADLPATLGIAALAVAAGGRVNVCPTPGWNEPTNLYTVVALEPGSRKSPTFSEMTRPLYAAERHLAEATAANRTETELLARRARAQAEAAARTAENAESDPAAAIAEAVAAAGRADELGEVPEPRLLADDLTPETAATLLATHGGRLGLLSAEGGSFTTLTGTRYSSAANLEPLLKAHAGDAMRIDRKGRPAERVDAPALTIAITTQPGNLASIAAMPEARERGLLARFLYCLPVNTVGTRQIGPPPVTDATRTAYGEHLARLVVDLWHLEDRATLTCTPEATEALNELQAWIEPRLHPATGSLAAVADWASKMAGTAVRLAGLLHLGRHGTAGLACPIDAATMADAVQLARYYLAHALAVFDAIGTDPAHETARKVLAWIDKAGPERFTRRELHRALESKAVKRAADLDAPLDLLLERGYLRTETVRNPNGGRPSTTFHVHPDLL